jgi:mevalonate kinase
MYAIAYRAGAAGAKLTGGGGGGCVIALAPGREASIVEAWERAGFKSFVTQVGG